MMVGVGGDWGVGGGRGTDRSVYFCQLAGKGRKKGKEMFGVWLWEAEKSFRRYGSAATLWWSAGVCPGGLELIDEEGAMMIDATPSIHVFVNRCYCHRTDSHGRKNPFLRFRVEPNGVCLTLEGKLVRGTGGTTSPSLPRHVDLG